MRDRDRSIQSEEQGRRKPSNQIWSSFALFSGDTPSFTIGLLALLLLTALGCWSCSQGDYSKKTVTIRIGVPPLEQNALLYVADHQKFFADHGLQVVIKDYDSGVTAIKGMLKGETDLAEAAEFPFVRAVFEKENIRVIACNDKFENDYIVGRKNRGLKNISDLKGKRIGLTLKTINEFYLGRFLSLNGLSLQQVTLVDLAPAQYVKAVASGEVDALIAWQPHIHRIEKEVKEVFVWPAQSSQVVYGLLLCSSPWLTRNSETVKGFLKSLWRAEDYLLGHPENSKALLRKRLGYDDSYIKSVWPRHNFSLSLDQTLIVAMKDEAQWMIDNHLTSEKQIPDFVNFIDKEVLQSVKPEAINIIR